MGPGVEGGRDCLKKRKGREEKGEERDLKESSCFLLSPAGLEGLQRTMSSMSCRSS